MAQDTHLSVISAEMRAAAGREMGRRVSYPVSDSDIRRWALAVYYPERPPRQYWDAAYAASRGLGGLVAPLDFNPFAWLSAEPGFSGPGADGNDPDQTEKTLGVPGPGLKFQLNGGVSARYGVRMRPGDVITSVLRLDGYAERTGRLGLMLFTTLVDKWTNQRGQLVKRTSLSLIRY
jgi:N-terminal half of MaoC dehydratase